MPLANEPDSAPRECDAQVSSQATRDRVMQVIGGMFAPDHIGPAAFQTTIREVRAGAAEHLVTMLAILQSASPADRSSLLPEELLSLIQPSESRESHRVASCLAALYSADLGEAERAAAGHTDDESTRRVSRVKSRWTLLRGLAAQPVRCVDEPCLASEVCVHPCCVGPCTPAAPYCAEKGAAPACPGKANGADLHCQCKQP